MGDVVNNYLYALAKSFILNTKTAYQRYFIFSHVILLLVQCFIPAHAQNIAQQPYPQQYIMNAGVSVDDALVKAQSITEQPFLNVNIENRNNSVAPATLSSNSLVVVDSNIKDYPKLVSALNSALNQRSSVAQALDFDELQLGQVIEVAGTPVLLLDPSKEPVSQVGDYLASHHKIKYLHYFSHGQQNKLRLGDSLLSLANVGDYQQRFERWAAGLEQQSQVLFYGCEVAKDQQGKALINRLSEYLNADVFASVDTTGAAQRQGDWELEYQSSEIAEQQALQDDSSSSNRNNEVERNQVATANSLELKQYQGSLAEIIVDPPPPARTCEVRWHKWQPSGTTGSVTLVEEDFNPIKYLAIEDGSGWWFRDDDNGTTAPSYVTEQVPSTPLPESGADAFPALFFGAMLYRGTPGELYTNIASDSGAADARAVRIVDGANPSIQLARYPSADYSYYVTGNRDPAGFPQEGNAVYADGTGGTGTGRHQLTITATIPASGLLQIEYIKTNPTAGVGREALANRSCIEINAVDDATQTVIAGFDSPLNVRDNDTLDIYSATVASVTIVSAQTVVTDASGTVTNLLSLANNGVISVDPTAPAGTYTVNYQICASEPGQALCDTAKAIIVVEPQQPQATIDKQAGTPVNNVAGEVITYTFVVTNTGNVNLDTISITDDKLSGSPFSVSGPLAPGATASVTATYTLTQADVDAGGVTNTATVEVTSPNGTTGSASDTVSTPITPAPGISVDKTADADTASVAGDVISYSFVVTNTGNVNLDTISITDDKLSGSPFSVSGPLAPGATASVTATYTLTQADVDAGGVTNTAAVSAKDPSGGDATGSDTVSTPITPAPGISVDKTADAGTASVAGDVISYSFVVTNTGNVNLDTISITDDKLSGSPFSVAGPLAPGATASVTATYTLTQADVDAGGVTNTAAVSAKDPSGGDATGSDTVSTPITPAPGISVDKTADAGTASVAGDVISYSFVVTNTGNVNLDTISITDDKLSGSPFSVAGPLAPGATASVTATYTLTQADVDAGGVTNTAAVSAKDPSGGDATGSDTVSTPITPAPGISVDKTADAGTASVAGDVISYSFVVTNTGNVNLDTISITDDKLNGSPFSVAGPLAPGATASVTATYTLTQADVDAGGVTNTAAVSAKDPSGGDATDSDTVSTPITPAPGISVDKTADAGTASVAGDVISYSFVVTNTGNVNLDTISITDDKLSGSPFSVSGPLAPGATASVTATYTLTQADVDAGGVTNTAAVSAKDPSGGDATDSDTVSTPITPAPGISVDKTADAGTASVAGDVISYSFVVTNTGNVNLDTISITDDKLSGSPFSVSGPLAPGATASVTATYTLTQADVDAGGVTNTAAVSAKDPSGGDATDSDTVSTPITPAPGISVDKTADAGTASVAGDVITYSFVVTNTGNVNLDTISITDDKLSGSPFSVAGPLAPNQTASVTATYTLTQADVDAGGVTNTAAVSAKDPSGGDATDSDTVSTPITPAPGISVDKTADAGTASVAGDVISYSFVVTNTGNVNLDTISITDDKLSGSPFSVAGPLAPNQTASVTATYTLTQADVDAGGVTNTAAVSAKDPSGGDATDSDTVSTPITPAPGISVDKTADAGTASVAGDVISYSFVVTNTGNVNLDTISITDDKLSGSPFSVSGPLAPGATASVTATYTLTQADVDAGGVTNTAAVSAKDPSGGDATGSDTVSTPITPAPGISVDKTADAGTASVAGDVISYSFVVTNTGNVNLDTISITDDKLSGSPFSVSGPLAPGATASVTATYTLTQADVDAGGVTNTAAVSAKDPSGGDATDSDTVSTPITPAPGISVDKTADAGTASVAGDVISYSFVVTNTGNVNLDTISITDDKLSGSPFSVSGPLAPNQTASVTATYTLTQADVDAGGVTNTAAVSAKDPSGGDATDSDTVSTPITPAPGISVDKTADAGTASVAGDVISYSFVVTNTGNVNLDTISITDDKLSGSPFSVSGPLAPGATASVTATYTLTQADVDAGGVTNTAAVSAKDPSGGDATDSDTVSTPITPAPGISVDKTADAGTASVAGDVITYSFVVTNTGNVNLDTISITDDKLSGSPFSVAGPLAPNQTASVTATYTLTQADVDAGGVTNTAAVSAKDPSGGDATDSDTVSTPITPAPGISVDKTADAGTASVAGDVISYSFVVTNTGNVNLDTISITDDKLSGSPFSVAGPLAPNQTASVTATYTLTQADVDAGGVTNTAAVSAKDPSGGDATDSDTVSTPITPAPGISVDKTADAGTASVAGDVISYSFVVTNTGNVNLDTISITDDKLSGSPFSVSGPLAPGATASVTATYTLTQADVDAGGVTNTAAVSAKDPSGGDATDSDTVSTPITPAPGISVDKTADAGTASVAGDVISYSFVVTNTGNVNLDTISITDDKLSGSPFSVSGPLAPGATASVTATYTLTQADVDAGGVTNTAAVSAKDPSGGDATDSDTVSTPITPAPGISVDKTADAGTASVAGDVITYSFVVTNTGNVNLDTISITDDKLSGSPFSVAGPLAPNQTASVTATYTLTQADVDAGGVTNTAAVSAKDPSGGDATDSDTVSTPITPAPGISVDKTADAGTASVAGDVISYSFVVTNTGNVNLDTISITDDKLSGSPFSVAGPLAPNQTASVTATYTLTQADVDAGGVTNTAAVSAKDPSGGDATDSDTVSTPITPAPGISVDKTADAGTASVAGDVISYSFVVTNTGNVNLDTISITDDKLSGSPFSVSGPLAPGATASVTATYTLTQADVDAGGVTNTAAVSAKDPSGGDATDSDTVSTPITPAPGISVDKTADAGTASVAGDVISYSFVVTNTGNVNLDTISITDDKLSGSPFSVSGPLAPGATASVTATYTLTQADVDAGGVTNTAAVSAKDPSGGDATDSDTVSTPITPAPGISVDKTADAGTASVAGDVISYSFVVTNTGNVNLDTISITDDKLSGSPFSVSGPLAPNQTASVTATYTLTQADVDAGGVTNTAAVSAKDPSGGDATDSDTVSTPITPAPGISVDKTADAGTASVAGDVISYSFVVTNTGNVNLDTISITDDKLSGSPFSVSGPLAPGATASVTATYTLTQADVDAGGVTNTAAVSAKDPSGGDATDSDTVSTPITPAPGISVDKTADAGTASVAGDVISYSFVVTNTGNVNLDTISITDDKLSGSPFSVSGPLAPGATASVTATYTLTQADVDAGGVTNTAAVSAKDPSGGDATDSDTVSTPIEAAPSLTIVKAGAAPQTPTVGALISYTFTVTNTGNVMLESITINDPLLDQAASCDPTQLNVSQTATCTGTHALTQQDLKAGMVINTATVSAQTPMGSSVTSSVASATVSLDVASIGGIIWLDEDGNNTLTVGSEKGLAGYQLSLYEADNGNSRDDLVAEVTSDSEGRYDFGALPPDRTYTVVVRDANGNFVNQTVISASDLPAGKVIELPLPIDPSGVVYDSVTREPVAGATVRLIDTATGNEIDSECLGANKSGQVTGADGKYEFLFQFGVNPSCSVSSGEYRIEITPPSGYKFESENIPVTAGTVTMSASGCLVNGSNVDAVSATAAICEIQVQEGAPSTSTTATPYYLGFNVQSGAIDVINNHIPLDPAPPNPTQYDLDKRVNKDDVSIGDVVRYSLVIKARGDDTQTGTVTLRDVMPAGIDLVKDTIRFVRVTAAGQRTAAEERVNEAGVDETRRIELSWQARTGDAYEVSYFGRIGAGASFGKRVNRAQLFGANGAAVSNVGEAAVRIGEDPILDKLTVIGKVFNDVNRNGIQDEELGELGLAGVRVISLSGQIITTDEYGRFHVPAVSAGSRDNGRNYLLKVDAASLPDGYEFSTENPRVLRITPGLLTRMNFGVYKPLEVDPVYEECTQTAIKRSIDESIAPVYFESGKNVISVATMNKLKALVSRYKAKERLHFTLEGRTDIERLAPKLRRKYASNKALALARAQVVASQLAQALGLSADQLTITATTTTKATASRDKSRDRRTDISVSYMDMSTSTEQCRALGAGAVQPNGAGSDTKEAQQTLYFDL